MNAPQGYRSIPKPAEQVPMVPYDRLRTGREVSFLRTRRITSKGEQYVVHEFLDAQTGKQFGIWGAALLDLQLQGIPRNAKMFLQYDGKEQRSGGRSAHSFTVAVADGTAVLGGDDTTPDSDEEGDDLPF